MLMQSGLSVLHDYALLNMDMVLMQELVARMYVLKLLPHTMKKMSNNKTLLMNSKIFK